MADRACQVKLWSTQVLRHFVFLERVMGSTDLSLWSTEGSNLGFSRSVLPGPAEVFAELRREKTRLKLLLELTNQNVSKQELRDVVRAVMMSVRSGVYAMVSPFV